MIDISRVVIARKKLSDDLEHVVYESADKHKIMLQIKLGKFSLERSFPNTNIGKMDMKELASQYNTEEKVKEYFNIKG